MFFESSGGVFDLLSVDSTRVGRFPSFKLVGGVVDVLRRARIHCPGVARTCLRVRVRVSSSLMCRAPRRILRTHPFFLSVFVWCCVAFLCESSCCRWVAPFFVVEALPVLIFSSLSLKSSAIVRLVVVLELVVLGLVVLVVLRAIVVLGVVVLRA